MEDSGLVNWQRRTRNEYERFSARRWMATVIPKILRYSFIQAQCRQAGLVGGDLEFFGEVGFWAKKGGSVLGKVAKSCKTCAKNSAKVVQNVAKPCKTFQKIAKGCKTYTKCCQTFEKVAQNSTLVNGEWWVGD